MPRSFLIKKHFQAKKKPLHDDEIAESKQPEDLTARTPSMSPDHRPSNHATTPPPAVALIARPAEESPSNVLEPLDVNAASGGGVWHHKSVAPPYLPFNFSSLYPAFPHQSSDYYHQVGARLVPPLYPISPPQLTAALPAEQLSPFGSPSSPLKKPEPLAPLPVDAGNNNNTNNHMMMVMSGSLSPSSSTGSSNGSSPSSNSSFLYQLWTSGDKIHDTDSSDSAKKQRREAPRYQCSDCNKSYSTFSGLTKHQQFHCITQAKKSFSCKYCEKVYVSLGALKMHIRTHTLPCKCKLCGKAFSRPWLLQGHIRTHTGEKPFACPHCNRAFADRSNLRAHLQTHSDVKKYSCKSCSKTFSRMSLLLKHEDGGCPTPHQ